jgi:hypothetical protein
VNVRRQLALGAALGLAGCGRQGLGAETETETTAGVEPECPFERIIDVRFPVHTNSEIVNTACELDYLGPPGSNVDQILISTDCGYQVELEGVSVPMIELAVGDAITVETLVDNPEQLSCADSGWLVVHDAQAKTQLVVAAVVADPITIPLGDLGDVELSRIDDDQGCAAVQLRAQGDAVSVAQASSAQIELAGARLQVELGPFRVESSTGCLGELYSIVLFRLPD